jgi:hypothetical protein
VAERDPGTSEGTVSFLAAGGAGKRAGLAAGPRVAYQAVLRAFAATGRPPEPPELEDIARRYGIGAGQTLAGLAAADVLGLDGEGRIRMAYPFCATPTSHVVAIADGPRVHAMCAIDALGIPPMLGADAVITSSDPLTGARRSPSPSPAARPAGARPARWSSPAARTAAARPSRSAAAT